MFFTFGDCVHFRKPRQNAGGQNVWEEYHEIHFIALLAVKFAIGAFLIPFAFVYGPELLMAGPVLMILVSAVTAAIGLVVLAAALEAYLFAPLSAWMRVVLTVLGLGMIAPSLQSSGASAVILAGLYAAHTMRQKRAAL